jgi:hypothetical protein
MREVKDTLFGEKTEYSFLRFQASPSRRPDKSNVKMKMLDMVARDRGRGILIL